MRIRFTQSVPGLILLMLAISPHHCSAADPQPATPLEGIWRWTFVMPDGSRVTPRLTLKREAGRLTGTTSFRPGTENAITNLTVNGNEVSFQVVRERDGRQIVTRYSGALDGDTIKGKITSNWSGENQSYAWDAWRAAKVEGTWKWSLAFGGFRAESTVRLRQDGEVLTGKYSSGRGGDSDVRNGKFEAGHISFEIERDRDGEKSTNYYYGVLTGDKILGKMELTFFGQTTTNVWEAIRVE